MAVKLSRRNSKRDDLTREGEVGNIKDRRRRMYRVRMSVAWGMVRGMNQ